MRVTYDRTADILCLVLREDPPSDSVEEPSGTVISYNANGIPVSIEFLEAASRHLIKPEALSVTLQTLSSAPAVQKPSE